MKILYLCKIFPKLSETFILNEIIGLIDSGHDVILLSENCPDEKIHEAVIEYDLLNRTIYLCYHSKIRLIIDFTKKIPLDFIKNPLTTLKNIFLMIGFYRAIWTDFYCYLAYRLLWNQKIDLVNTPFSSPEHLCKAFFLSKLLKTPFTSTFRAYDLYDISHLKELKCMSKIIKKASGVITISSYNKENLIKKFEIAKVNLVHEAIDLEDFKPLRLNKGKDIITICRFVEQKGVKYLLEACNILQERKIKNRCIIVGIGPEEKIYKSIIKKYSLHSVVFTGPLTQRGVKKKLDSSALFVLPCIIANNGRRDILPNVLKEAMAMELPVVASDICGIRELVEDGVNGILVPPKNPEALADAIEKLLKNPKLKEKMGKSGRKKIEKDFNIKAEVKKLEKVFCKAVKNHKCRNIKN